MQGVWSLHVRMITNIGAFQQKLLSNYGGQTYELYRKDSNKMSLLHSVGTHIYYLMNQ